jgi:hypothetical protein
MNNTDYAMFVKGSISGMFGILLSHPIDSIKTYNQTHSKQFLIDNKFKYTFGNLYKGIYSPLLGVGIEKSIVFGVYNYCKKEKIPIAISGGISGFIASAIVSPYERIKLLKQTNQKIILDFKFLFKGLGISLTREVPGFAIYFYTYEKLKDTFYTSKNKQINLFSSFLFGGISGSFAWIFIYPQDRIKTLIQSQSGSQNHGQGQGQSGVKQIIKIIYNSGGIKEFYRGFSYALLRAILLHSGTFTMMEILSKDYFDSYPID